MSNCVWVNLVDALLGGGRWMDVDKISRRSSWSILIFFQLLVLASQRGRSHYPIPTCFIQSSATHLLFPNGRQRLMLYSSEILFSVWIQGSGLWLLITR
jgi:hypothetical protein